jgi:beta-glucosidase
MPGDIDHSEAEYAPDSSLTETLGQEGGITLGELQRSARNVLNLILNLKKPA